MEIIYENNHLIIVTTPPQKRTIIIQRQGSRIDDYYFIDFPCLIFVIHHLSFKFKRLLLFSTKEKICNLDGLVYRTFLPNMMHTVQGTYICLGEFIDYGISAVELAEKCISRFWHSKFSSYVKWRDVDMNFSYGVAFPLKEALSWF